MAITFKKKYKVSHRVFDFDLSGSVTLAPFWQSSVALVWWWNFRKWNICLSEQFLAKESFSRIPRILEFRSLARVAVHIVNPSADRLSLDNFNPKTRMLGEDVN